MHALPTADRWSFQRFVESSVSEGFLRAPVVIQGMAGSHIARNGRPYVNFSGINSGLATGAAGARCVLRIGQALWALEHQCATKHSLLSVGAV